MRFNNFNRVFTLPAALLLLTSVFPKPEAVRSSDQIVWPPLTGSLTATAEERGVVALDQALRDLTNPYTVMCIAAHPDDVDYPVLALLRKKLGARTVIVSLTRGEGRESTTPSPTDEEPVVFNTRQAIEAARAVGADLYFLNLRDFGPSKSEDEALAVWNPEDALRRISLAIRSFRPDIIITNHNPKTGPGQHRAAARLIARAFEAAADPKRIVEPDSEAWQASRLFQKADETDADLTIDNNQYDHTRGRTYAEIGLGALELLSPLDQPDRHSSQEKSRYKLILSAGEAKMKPVSSLLDGLSIPENLARSLLPPRVGDFPATEALAQRERLIEVLTEKLIDKRAEGTSADLRTRYGVQFFRALRYTESLERAIALGLGISFELIVSDEVLIEGQPTSARMVFRNGSNQRLPVLFHAPQSLKVGEARPAFKPSEVIEVAAGAVATEEIKYEAQKGIPLTIPHSAEIYKENYYPLGSALPGAVSGRVFGHWLVAVAEVGLGQTSVTLTALARVDVAPAVEMASLPFVIVKDWSREREVELPIRLRNRTPGELAGEVWVIPLAVSRDDYEPVHVGFTREDEHATVRLKLRVPISKPPLSGDILIEFRRARPAAPDSLNSIKVAVKTVAHEVAEGISVGYIEGPGSWLQFALTQLGVEHVELSPDRVLAAEAPADPEATARPRRACGDLGRFQTVIIGERAASVLDRHPKLTECLLEYVRRGGNLVVLYQKEDEWNPLAARRAASPFNIKLSAERITVETAPVKILEPNHPALTKPNIITAKDFEGWVGDRAAYLPQEWPAEFVPLVESADPGEEPQKGGLLFARSGEGTFVYTSFTWGRQIMAINPGAYRILANLISLPKVIKSQGNK
jgi:LmbE family N-acetylglucosaminyl deacetylase